jgi:hypothetical protein
MDISPACISRLKYDYINYWIIITMKSSSAAEGGRMSMGEDDDSQIN